MQYSIDPAVLSTAKQRARHALSLAISPADQRYVQTIETKLKGRAAYHEVSVGSPEDCILSRSGRFEMIDDLASRSRIYVRKGSNTDFFERMLGIESSIPDGADAFADDTLEEERCQIAELSDNPFLAAAWRHRDDREGGAE